MMIIRYPPVKTQKANLARFAHPPPENTLGSLQIKPSSLSSPRSALLRASSSSAQSAFVVWNGARSVAALPRALAQTSSSASRPPFLRLSRSRSVHVATSRSLTCFAGFARRPSLRSGKPFLPKGDALATALHNQISATPRRYFLRSHHKKIQLASATKKATLLEPHIAKPPLGATRSAFGDGKIKSNRKKSGG